MAASLQREKDGLDAMIGHEVALRDGEKENVRLNGIKKRLEEEHQALKVSLTDCEAQIQVLTCSKGQLEQKVRGFEEADQRADPDEDALRTSLSISEAKVADLKQKLVELIHHRWHRSLTSLSHWNHWQHSHRPQMQAHSIAAFHSQS